MEINHKYGSFTSLQVLDYKTKMRKKIFWLILYTDDKTNFKYKDVDVVSYLESIMRQLDGLNYLLSYPAEFVELLSILSASLIELKKDDFNFRVYRKLILDAGAMVDNLKVGD